MRLEGGGGECLLASFTCGTEKQEKTHLDGHST